jgi:asparagine synthase (glutamine-hydrolysing)
MCGIFGHFHPVGADPAMIERMAQKLAHRGPDGYGIYHDGRFTFGAGRLAIIDLSAPAGPIFSEDRRIGVVFNGEIYNYKALRAELERAGHVFATHTDTEVIVHGYEQWGVGVIERLRGMFALCVWDAPQDRLLLARDRMGEKPLYYAMPSQGEFLFASEAKALFEHPQLCARPNPEMLPHFLILGYAPPPHTMFAGIDKLAPGERVIVQNGRIHKEFYWQPHLEAVDPPPYEEAVRQVRAALEETVTMQMMSDVPIGAFLSGGLDSSAVVAVMAQRSAQPVQTFTVGFDYPPDSKGDVKFNVDARYAKLVSERLKTEHHIITLREDDSLSALLPHLIYAMDEPVAIPTIVQTAYVAGLARKQGVPVLLNGEAGDELFLGYNHYRLDQTLDRYKRIPSLLRDGLLNPIFERLPGARFDNLRKLARKARQTDPAARYLEWLRLIEPERLPSLVADEKLANKGGEQVRALLRPLLAMPNTPHFADRTAYASLRLPLPENGNVRVDKMSMAMSVEARSPLEDYKLVELALRLPLEYKLRRGDFKTILKDAVADIVPREVLTRPKWGFNPPASDWLRRPLRPLVDRVLSPEYVTSVGVFRPETIMRALETHRTGGYELWPLWTALVFHVWHALYIDHSLTLEGAFTPDALYRGMTIPTPN